MQEIPVWFLGQEDPLQKRLGWLLQYYWGFPCASVGKESAYNVGDQGLIPGSENPQKGKATHSSILVWRIPSPRGSQKSQTQLSNLDFHRK